jgi:ribose-phosphate pyrophosphokinase
MAAPVLVKYIHSLDLKDLVIISPDAGGVGRARWFAKRLDADLAIIDKRRPAPNVAKVFNVIGEVKERNSIIVDDMVDTAGTLAQSAEALKENGALRVFAACTHPVLSGQAVERINKSNLEKLIVTNTIPLNNKTDSMDRLVVLSVAGLFGEAIRRINKGLSVSSLFT